MIWTYWIGVVIIPSRSCNIHINRIQKSRGNQVDCIRIFSFSFRVQVLIVGITNSIQLSLRWNLIIVWVTIRNKIICMLLVHKRILFIRKFILFSLGLISSIYVQIINSRIIHRILFWSITILLNLARLLMQFDCWMIWNKIYGDSKWI